MALAVLSIVSWLTIFLATATTSAVARLVAALRGHFRLAGWPTVLVLAECAVLAFNGGRCPLTDVAARFTPGRDANFDIYLPRWLAQRNKMIFGGLFVLGELVFLWRWMAEKNSPRLARICAKKTASPSGDAVFNCNQL